MPYEMKNCVLWHVPKTGGSWASRLCTKNKLILNKSHHVKGHLTPDMVPNLLLKPGIAFIREPLPWYKSMFMFGVLKHSRGQHWFERWIDNDFWNKGIIDPVVPDEKYDYRMNFEKFIKWNLENRPGLYTKILNEFQISRFIICNTENLTEEFSKVLPLFEDITADKIKSFAPTNVSNPDIKLLDLKSSEKDKLRELEKHYIKNNKTKVYLTSEEVFDFIDESIKNNPTSKNIHDKLNFLNIAAPNDDVCWSENNLLKFYDNKLFKTDKSKVSVIVAGRNYGRFLTDCFTSIFSQTLRPLEVIYSDDGSTDNSISVAENFLNVKIVKQEHIRGKNGVAKARNNGAKIAKGDYLLFVDADDMLVETYIQNNSEIFEENPKAVGVYNQAHAFQKKFNYWDVPEWDEAILWHRNYCNTSTMYRATIFRTVGGWKEELNTGWDWNLAIRISRHGDMIRGDASLFYRFHKENWSDTNPNSLKNSLVTTSITRQTMAKVNICCVLSDRIIENFDKWLEAITESVDHYNKVAYNEKFVFPVKPNLTIMYTGKDRTQIPNICNDTFSDIKFIFNPFDLEELNLTKREKGNAVSNFLSNAYNKLMEDSNAEVFWFIEDDIIVPPNAFHSLYTNLFNDDHTKFATCGVYGARHDGHLLAYSWNETDTLAQQYTPTLPKAIDFPEENKWIGCTGTGCLMIFRPLANHHFSSHHLGSPAHDWSFSWGCTKKNHGWPSIFLCADVHCKHMIDSNKYVDAKGDIKDIC